MCLIVYVYVFCCESFTTICMHAVAKAAYIQNKLTKYVKNYFVFSLIFISPYACAPYALPK